MQVMASLAREKREQETNTMKTYQQKDLGYPREATSAMFRVTMPDGSRWDVPVQAIADSRDENYQDDKEDTIAFIRAKSLGRGEIEDWAVNNMNWDDVKEYATQAVKPEEPDLQDGWVNGEKEIVGKL